MISKARLQEIRELLLVPEDEDMEHWDRRATKIVSAVPELLAEFEVPRTCPVCGACETHDVHARIAELEAGCDGIDARGEHGVRELAQLQGKVEFLEGCLRSRMEHARLSRGAARNRIAALEAGLREALGMWLDEVGGACAPGEDVDYDRLRALVPLTEDEAAGLSALNAGKGSTVEQVRQKTDIKRLVQERDTYRARALHAEELIEQYVVDEISEPTDTDTYHLEAIKRLEALRDMFRERVDLAEKFLALCVIKEPF